MVNKITMTVAGRVELILMTPMLSNGSCHSPIGVKGFGFFASLDKDDELGKLELNVSASGPAVEERTWSFRKTAVFGSGWSTGTTPSATASHGLDT
jgi:hypothetical protein